MSRQVSRGSAVEYQADEQAGDNLSVFSSVVLTPPQGHEDTLHMFSSASFIVLPLAVRSRACFEWIFMNCVK